MNKDLKLFLLPTLAAICLIVLTALPSCRKGTEIPDVSDVDGSFPLTRFEKALLEVDTLDAANQLASIKAQNPALWDIYFRFVIPVTEEKADSVDFSSVVDMLKAPRMRWLMDTVTMILPDLSPEWKELEEAFKYYRHYFPERRTPHVYTVVSDFGFFPFIFPDVDGRDGVGVSLEMFLGQDFPFRAYTGNHPVFSNYLLRTYNRDHLAKKTIEVIVDDLLGPEEGNRMLDYMIRNGKKLYLLKQFLPFTSDTIITEYSPEKLQWCRDNERNLWAHFLAEDLLYSVDYSKFQKLIQHSPNAPGLPPEAPGRTANWMGYQIVQAYMARHPNATLQDLIALRDPQALMDKSKYKPL